MIPNPNVFYAIIGLLCGVILYLVWKTTSLKRKIAYLENTPRPEPSFNNDSEDPLVNEAFETAVSDALNIEQEEEEEEEEVEDTLTVILFLIPN